MNLVRVIVLTLDCAGTNCHKYFALDLHQMILLEFHVNQLMQWYFDIRCNWIYLYNMSVPKAVNV